MKLVFSAMKDEGPDVLEWVCYQHAVGFDEVLVYTNDCTDGSDDLLDALQAAGLVHHRRHSVRDQSIAPQDAAARLIIADPVYRRADWALWADADEFLLPLLSHDVSTLVAMIEDRAADAMAVPWRNFGSSDHVDVPAGLVIEEFTMTSAKLTRMERTFKCLFRTSVGIEQLFVHRPIWAAGTAVRMAAPDLTLLPDEIAYCTKDNGRPDELLPREFKNRPRAAQINHYAVKSLRQFLLKRTRRSGLGNKGRFADGYLNRFDVNEVERTEIHRFIPAVKQMISKALTDPAVQETYITAIRRRDERMALGDPAQILRVGRRAESIESLK